MPKTPERAAFGIYPQAGKRGRKPNAKAALEQAFSDERAMSLPQFGEVDLDVPTAANRAMGRRMVERDVDLKRQADRDMSPLEKLAGGIQTGRLIGSGLTQAIKSIPTAITKGGKAAEDYIAENIYQPNQPKAYEYAGDVADFLTSLETDYKLPPVLPEAVAIQSLLAPATRQAGKAVKKGAKQGALNLMTPRTLNPQAGVFIGPKAKTFHQGRADMAVAMEEAGRTPQEIWQATGTFRGPDGAWRQEIDDSKAVHRYPHEIKLKAGQLKEQQQALKEAAKESLIRGKEVVSDLFPKEAIAARQALKKQVGNIDNELGGYYGLNADPQRGNYMKYGYQHPELYEAYPELAEIVLRQNNRGSPGMLGSQYGNQVNLYERGLLQKNPGSTIAHELQHAIQDIEKTATGGNVEMFQRERYEANNKIGALNDRMTMLVRLKDEETDPAVKAVLQKQYDETMDEKLKLIPKANIEPHDAYRRLAGEAEARAVQSRLDMTPSERMAKFPLESYDVPIDELDIRTPTDRVHISDNPDVMQLELAGGGLVKKGIKAIKGAAESAGQKAPVLAEKDLTTLQDVHTSLGDRVRAGAMEAQKMMGGFDYQYDKGQRVFTKDSAGKNKPPYTIVNRTRVGNQVMREDHPEFGPGMGRPVIDPETGKPMRTPYEPGYRVRMERGPDDWSEFEIPQKAIVGDVEMAGGGLVKGLKAAAKAAKPAKEAAVPLTLPRVRPTTKDIFEAAERVGKQQAGEFVKTPLIGKTHN